MPGVHNMKLGEKLKALRIKKKLTLQQLSEISKVSIGQLSQIERSISTPTISKIQQIVTALDITLAGLFNEDNHIDDLSSSPYRESGPRCLVVVRANERKRLYLPNGTSLELLAPVHGNKIEFICLNYPAGCKVEDVYTHNGEECGLVLKGKFKGIIGNEEVVLEAGDSIYFDSTTPHRWENIGDTEVKAIWAITPPSI